MSKLFAFAIAFFLLPLAPTQTIFAQTTTPNDPDFGWQTMSLSQANVMNLWAALVPPSSSSSPIAPVPVVIIDTGIECSHEDLWDVINIPLSQTFVGGSPCFDDWNHGTAVAGVVGAHANNGMGVAGIAWGTEIISFKAVTSLTIDGQNYYWMGDNGDNTAVNALNAVAQLPYPLVIVNASQAWTWPSPRILAALAALGNKALVVAAAGNNGYDNFTSGQDVTTLSNSYLPCMGSALPNVICIGSVDLVSYSLSVFSNWGIPVQLAAPGGYVWTTQIKNTYGPDAGTSIASPVVAGIADTVANSLIYGGVPVSAITPALLKQALISGAALDTALMGTPNPINEPRLVDGLGTLIAAKKLVNGQSAEVLNPAPMSVAAVTDAINFGPDLHRQSWSTLWGTGFGVQECTAGTDAPAVQLCSLQVLMNGTALALAYVGPTQINAYIPYSPLVAKGSGNQLVVVRLDEDGRQIVKSATLALNQFTVVWDPYHE